MCVSILGTNDLIVGKHEARVKLTCNSLATTLERAKARHVKHMHIHMASDSKSSKAKLTLYATRRLLRCYRRPFYLCHL